MEIFPIGPLGRNGTYYDLNDSLKRAALAFIAQNTSVQGFYTLLQPMGGSPPSVSVQFDLMEDLSGLPSGTSLATVTVTDGWGSSLFRNIPLSASGLTVGNRYWVMMRNVGSTPATYYPRVAHIGNISPLVGGMTAISAPTRYVSTDSGSTWTSGTVGLTAVFPVYSDGIDTQNCYMRDATSNTDGTKIYSGTSVGVDLIIPDIPIWLHGITLQIKRVGSPAGTIKAVLYIGMSKVAESQSYDAGAVSTGEGTLLFQFTTPVQIYRAQNIQIMLEASAGDTSNYIGHQGLSGLASNPELYPLRPFGGTLRKIVLSGGAWTIYDQYYMNPCILWVTKATEPANRRTSTGR